MMNQLRATKFSQGLRTYQKSEYLRSNHKFHQYNTDINIQARKIITSALQLHRQNHQRSQTQTYEDTRAREFSIPPCGQRYSVFHKNTLTTTYYLHYHIRRFIFISISEGSASIEAEKRKREEITCVHTSRTEANKSVYFASCEQRYYSLVSRPLSFFIEPCVSIPLEKSFTI
jgi:hypothetical protein